MLHHALSSLVFIPCRATPSTPLPHINLLAGVPGITLHTSEDGGNSFKTACLPVALKVSVERTNLALAPFFHRKV